jgi:quercetin dioxygenase-like cupin family protein
MNRTLYSFAVALSLAGVGCEGAPSHPPVTSPTEPKPSKPAPGRSATVAPSSAAAPGPLFVSPADGEVWRLFGDQIIRKVAGKHTGGAYAVILVIVPPGNGPPPHLHHDEDELFMVEEGEFEFRSGDAIQRGVAGTIAVLPRGLPHTFHNVGKTPGKVYVVITPARFESFFVDVHALPESERDDLAKVTAIGKNYNLEIPFPLGGAAPTKK